MYHLFGVTYTSIYKVEKEAEKEMSKQTYLLFLPFDPEDGSSAFLRNTGKTTAFQRLTFLRIVLVRFVITVR
jgi:hypothetical protein